jgi:5'-3' exonuclease
MRKKIYLSESELISVIKKTVKLKESENVNEYAGFPWQHSVEPDVPETPRERQIKGAFGSYSETVMDDAFRYLRKNPRQFFKKLWEIYGEKAYTYLDMASGKPNELSEDNDEDIALSIGAEGNSDLALAMSKDVTESDDYEDEDEYNPRQDLINALKSKIDSGEDLDESDIRDIYDDGKPFRTGRGSIYVDIMVPETDDKEFDRDVAKKMMEYYSKQVKDENYVGGVGFKNRGNLIQPYDNMDF